MIITPAAVPRDGCRGHRADGRQVGGAQLQAGGPQIEQHAIACRALGGRCRQILVKVLALQSDPALSGIRAVRIVTRAAARSWSAPISTPLYSAGAMNMAGQPEFSESQHLVPVLRAVETGDPIGNLMVGGSEGFAEVRVGLEALAGCSLVAYTLPGPVRAAVGVLGPLRMNYSLAYAVVDRMGSRLTEVLNG